MSLTIEKCFLVSTNHTTTDASRFLPDLGEDTQVMMKTSSSMSCTTPAGIIDLSSL